MLTPPVLLESPLPSLFTEWSPAYPIISSGKQPHPTGALHLSTWLGQVLGGISFHQTVPPFLLILLSCKHALICITDIGLSHCIMNTIVAGTVSFPPLSPLYLQTLTQCQTYNS